MINELYLLSEALNRAEIQTQKWHHKYTPIPKIRSTAPCIRITCSCGKIAVLSEVSASLGSILRKYGSGGNTFPCMNLVPLYRITDEARKKELTAMLRTGDFSTEKLHQIKEWCQEDNWDKKFLNKYRLFMVDTPTKLQSVASEYTPLKVLIEESLLFSEPMIFRQQLETIVWEMLEHRESIRLALQVLFHLGKSDQSADDHGTLSVALESTQLIEMGIPSVSEKFVLGFNQALLAAESSKQSISQAHCFDAFGLPFKVIDDPMPKVKLAGGFDVTLRTMFKAQYCQSRYGRYEGNSYPISSQMRKNIHSALEWLSSAERNNITWINTDKNEILFAYPYQLPELELSFIQMFHRPRMRDKDFEELSRLFLSELSQSKKIGTDSHAGKIHLFILKKLDKARTKVIYTRQTNPNELEKRSEEWTLGCSQNIPSFPFGQPNTPFPLEVADILNRFWKQNGEISTDKLKPIPKYHGLEMLMESDLSVDTDLHRLSEQAMALGAFLGKLSSENDLHHPIWGKTKEMLALMGLLLYRKGIRKDSYMENLPYLYGQLLKAADELHALYCNIVRQGDIPPQLAGGSLFQAATEAPIRTLNLLSQRIMPYYTWAKSYRLKNITETGKESWRAGWLLSMCERITTMLHTNWTQATRFTDAEKAQMFIGYLAAFPKKDQEENSIVYHETEEVHFHE